MRFANAVQLPFGTQYWAKHPVRNAREHLRALVEQGHLKAKQVELMLLTRVTESAASGTGVVPQQLGLIVVNDRRIVDPRLGLRPMDARRYLREHLVHARGRTAMEAAVAQWFVMRFEYEEALRLEFPDPDWTKSPQVRAHCARGRGVPLMWLASARSWMDSPLKRLRSRLPRLQNALISWRNMHPENRLFVKTVGVGMPAVVCAVVLAKPSASRADVSWGRNASANMRCSIEFKEGDQVARWELIKWLFRDGPKVTDIDQGTLGDCYLLATLGAFAERAPELIYAMFGVHCEPDQELRLRSPSVRFRDVARGWVKAPCARAVAVKKDGTFLYAQLRDGEGWVNLAEGVFTRIFGKGKYANIVAGSSRNVFFKLTGLEPEWLPVQTTDAAKLVDMIELARKKSWPMTADTFAPPGEDSGHEYTVLGAGERDGKIWIDVYNPHGQAEEIALPEFLRTFEFITWIELTPQKKRDIMRAMANAKPLS